MTTLAKQKYIIIHVDGSTKEITEEQKDKIMNFNGKSLELDNGFIMMHSISKILTLDEYYHQYPDKRPYVPVNQFDNYKESALDKHYVTRDATKLIKDAFEKQYKYLYPEKNIMENSVYLTILKRFNQANK